MSRCVSVHLFFKASFLPSSQIIFSGQRPGCCFIPRCFDFKFCASTLEDLPEVHQEHQNGAWILVSDLCTCCIQRVCGHCSNITVGSLVGTSWSCLSRKGPYCVACRVSFQKWSWNIAATLPLFGYLQMALGQNPNRPLPLLGTRFPRKG